MDVTNFASQGKSELPDYSTKITSKSMNTFPHRKAYAFSDHLSLEGSMNIDSIFSIVKKSVKNVIGKERSGLGLAFSNLPWNLGAFWQVGGNYIVMNEGLVNSMKGLSKSEEEFNSFIYMILAHEYIHSLGFIDELEARRMTAIVATRTFGKDHIVSKMSTGDIWSLYPDLKYSPSGNGEELRFIRNFDSSTTSYIA
ncbi:MAG: hypothetical protein ACYCSG_00945 [Thermoplasmataceae archaeon]